MKFGSNKTGSLLKILIIYLLTLISGYFMLTHLAPPHSVTNVLYVDIGVTFIVFLFSFIYRNSSIYDPYWSVIPPFIAAWLIYHFPEGNSVRQVLILVLILFWSVRLTTNWARGWQGLNHEDWRYQKIAKDTGKFYWPVNFLGIHLMPTLFVFSGCLPLWFAFKSDTPVNALDLVAFLVTFAAILTEWISDDQLRKFKKTAKKDEYMNKGLWSVMRHPNYFGEIMFWFGLFLFVPASHSFEGWWTALGFISMIMLFNFISIPLMEKRNRERKAGYDDYISDVHALIPIRKRKG